MKYLVISDIHANFEALTAVLEKSAGYYDKLVCLGDFVGYGPEPNEVINWAKNEKDAIFILGNHDTAVIGDESSVFKFNERAKLAVNIHKDIITDDNKKFLKTLPKQIIENGICFVHGNPKDEAGFSYLYKPDDVTIALQYMQLNNIQKTFIGHTHYPYIWNDCRGNERIINVGSVGQPRDNNPEACFVTFDSVNNLIKVQRTPYNINKTQQKMTKMLEHYSIYDRLIYDGLINRLTYGI